MAGFGGGAVYSIDGNVDEEEKVVCLWICVGRKVGYNESYV